MRTKAVLPLETEHLRVSKPRSKRRLSVILALSVCLSVLNVRDGALGQTLVGVAETEITPPKGFPIAGYYYERLAAGVHDPLKAKAIVFLGKSAQAALVVCDLTGIAADLTAEVRRRAAEKTGIPASNIIVAGTHSHTAPDYGKDLYESLAKPGDGKRSHYSETLIDRIVEAIEKSKLAAQPVVLLAGSAVQNTPISFNRRFVMKDGSVRTWMALNNPDVVRAAGPIDPEVSLVLVRSAADEKPLGLFTNFALHLDTVGGLNWSADYPYDLEQELRKSLGTKLISVFANGCCGDINHIDPSRRDRNRTDFIGRSLAATIQPALATLRRVDKPDLRVRNATVHLPLQEISAADVRQAEQTLKAFANHKEIEFFQHVAAYKTIMLDGLRNRPPYSHPAEFLKTGLSHGLAGVGDSLPVDVQVICLGQELAIVCLPGEVFVDLGLAIKRGSPFRTTLVVELSNCVETLYIPTRAAYAGGGYEVTNSAVQPGSGEALVEAALRLLRSAATEVAQQKAAAPAIPLKARSSSGT
jgi:neutral ceramidase